MELKTSDYYAGNRLEMLGFIPATSKKILEVGCGSGNFCEQLRGEGKEIWGIEPDIDSAMIAATKIHKIINKNLNDSIAELPNDYFDVIIFNDVLEHLMFPWDDLQLIKAKLAPNGVIVASVPNVRYIKNIYNMLVGKNWEYTENGILDSTHFRFFTKKSIYSLFKKSGYTIENIKGINKSKSIKYTLFAWLLHIFFLSNQSDSLYMQFAVMAKKNDS